MKHIKVGLLPRIIIAILLGVLLGNFLTLPWVRVFATFNMLFSQFLGFMIPLIIVGLVTPAIAQIGHSAGRLLLTTVAIAYGDTVVSALLAYGTGLCLFPSMVENTQHLAHVEQATAIAPYFSIQIPPILDVMSGLVFAFMMGLVIAYVSLPTLNNVFVEFRTVITKTIEKAIIPLLPIYIFGIFLMMTHTGEAYRIMLVFVQIICVIFVLHILILLYQFCVAGMITMSIGSCHRACIIFGLVATFDFEAV